MNSKHFLHFVLYGNFNNKLSDTFRLSLIILWLAISSFSSESFITPRATSAQANPLSSIQCLFFCSVTAYKSI